ncbi:hypothetical protein L1887_36062 [Cichorium endivia]|nr:hypothetical protein L1887_36062 [Cichorium endivia]
MQFQFINPPEGRRLDGGGGEEEEEEVVRAENEILRDTISHTFIDVYCCRYIRIIWVIMGHIDENVRVGLKSLPVVVKVLNKEGLQGHRESLTEVNFLGQLRQPNLVKLIGYCCEDDHRLLV